MASMEIGALGMAVSWQNRWREEPWKSSTKRLCTHTGQGRLRSGSLPDCILSEHDSRPAEQGNSTGP